MLKIANDIIYNLPLEKKHRFPMLKYKLLPELLINEGTCTNDNFFCPGDICDDDILLTHNKFYFDIKKKILKLLIWFRCKGTGYPVPSVL